MENELYKLKAKLQKLTEKANAKEGKYNNASIRLYKPQNKDNKWVLGIFFKKRFNGIADRYNSRNFNQYCVYECLPDSTIEDVSKYIEELKQDLDNALQHYIEHKNEEEHHG